VLGIERRNETGKVEGDTRPRKNFALIPNMMYLWRDSMNTQNLFQIQREAN